ncbi:PlxyGVORF88-like protein [Hyphantria cunea granulovirus]|uniref:PlxyGVORF88-like protein n=1 Tax=Hyphantria cunea granulovirus TaxID=307448 RepID=A0AAF1D2A0_9BBAC|nr:PlxyGVORF88-like protein [Hyphantria cunea granulovirus]QBQ01646.1 PlxyGVORF88-like protein [Hyphantria cunea granulovirus]
MNAKLTIPFDKLTITNPVDAIPLKLAYTKNDESPQSFYNTTNTLSDNSPVYNIWFVVLCCVAAVILILILVYYLINNYYVNTPPDEADEEELLI